MNATARTSVLLLSMLLTHGVAAVNNPKLAWDPNTEPALAGYKLYFGTESRGCIGDPLDERFTYRGGAALQGGAPIVIFLNELQDLNNPSYLLAGLPATVNRFAVTAFDSNGLESRYSDEVRLAGTVQPPIVCATTADTSTAVVVEYSQFVEQASATALANYVLSDAATSAVIPITGVVFDPNFKQVTLTVSALLPNISYRLTINGVKDFFDPVFIAPNTQRIFTYTAAPTLRGALALNHAPPHLQLEFNKGITALSANLSTHYAVLDITSGAGVNVTAANLALDRNYADNDRTVDLTTAAPLIEGHQYRITVNNVVDHEGHAIAADSTLNFNMPVDTVPPTAVSAHVTNPLRKRNEVHVVFDEEIDPTSAATAANYLINNGIQVGSATLFDDHKTVVLATSPHPDGAYQITIAGIRDHSVAKNLMTPSILSYRVLDNITDTDGDGRENVRDNCPALPNPDQRDTDGDGFGNRCDADFNGDGRVNTLDFGIFKQAFGKTTNPNADLNGDGRVNTLDFGIFKQLFGKSLF